MPRNRKLFIHNRPILVTTRTEEGLPFVATAFMNLILWGILARARKLYRIRVCHFVFMENHFHMLLVVDDPEDVPKFVRYVKTESSHAVNRLLGRRKRTVWCDGYDSPVILTPSDVIRYIVYIYSNPLKDKRVRRIKNYPGVSSWLLFRSDSSVRSCHCVPRSAIKPLKSTRVSLLEGKRIARELQMAAPRSQCDFLLEPNAWMDCFPETRDLDPNAVNQDVFRQVAEIESSLRSQWVVGAEKLQTEDMLRCYVPKKFGRRMICICSDQELRRAFVGWFRSLCENARETFLRWKRGDFGVTLPPGFLAPGNFLQVNVNPDLLIA